MNLLVIAKQPVPGRVKTRLCPPCTPAEAAAIASAAIDDTAQTAQSMPGWQPTLVYDGDTPPASCTGWRVVAQRPGNLDERLAAAFADAATPATPAILIGMDTPQVTPQLLTAIADDLDAADACLGYATDGGWWTLGLRDPAHAILLRGIPTSTDRTGELTHAALTAAGLTVRLAPILTDVDTFADARSVAAAIPTSRFAAAVAAIGGNR
jgi:rSAM/selenodomain-associated transferase 1